MLDHLAGFDVLSKGRGGLALSSPLQQLFLRMQSDGSSTLPIFVRVPQAFFLMRASLTYMRGKA
jgi:hypothetical protein